MDLSEFNNNYSTMNSEIIYHNPDGVFSNILNNTGTTGTTGTTSTISSISSINTNNNNSIEIDFNNYISERISQENTFRYSVNSNTNSEVNYNKIFSAIKQKLFVINKEDSLSVDERFVNHFNEKYLMEESLTNIRNLKQKIVELHVKKIEIDLIFTDKKERYSQFTENILLLIKNIREENNINSVLDDQLVELLTNKIEWYYQQLNLEQLKNDSTKINNEYSFVKYLLSEIAGLIPAVVCQICLEDQITHFINDCGHTLCTNCMEKSKNIKKCHFCRNTILSFKKLYL
jgi:hypothetical protein